MIKPFTPIFLTVCLNPTMQKTLVLEEIREGQVNRCQKQLLDASGKGINVTRVLRQLGADVTHITQLGGFLKEEFLEKTGKDGLTVSWVPSGSEIRFCYTLINKSSRTVTEIVEEGEPVSEKTEEIIRKNYEKLVKKADSIIISGSKAKGFSTTIFPDMVKTAKGKGAFVILDFRGDDLLNALPFKPDIIKPNMVEFMETFFPDQQMEENEPVEMYLPAIKEKVRELYKKYKTAVVLTNGKQPSLYYNGENFEQTAPESIEPVNTIGSGDAFTAGLAWKLSRGASLREAVIFAHQCGAKNAGFLKPGVIR